MQALWMALGALFFSMMGVCIKMASPHYGSMEIVLYRGITGVVLLSAMMWARRIPLATPVPGLHVRRNLWGVVAMSLWFFAITKLPFAMAMMFNNMSSLWLGVIILTVAWWRTRTLAYPKLFAAVALGFTGVVLLLDPRSQVAGAFWSNVAGLASGVGSAFAYAQIQARGEAGEPEWRTVVYLSVGTVIIGLLGSFVFYGGLTPLQWHTFGWLPATGLFAALGQWCLTRAYSRGMALVVANLQYLGLVFSSLIGVWLFNDRLSSLSWLGMGIIVTSSVAATLLRPKRKPASVVAANTPPAQK